MNATISEIICDIVEFFPHHKKMSFVSSADLTSMDAAYLTEALLNPNTEAPYAQIGETHLGDLIQLTTLFKARLKKRVHLQGWNIHHQH